MNKKFNRIICGVMCMVMMIPMLAGCDKEKDDTNSEVSVPHVTSMDTVNSVPETFDIPAQESPLAKEEFVFGNVFFLTRL